MTIVVRRKVRHGRRAATELHCEPDSYRARRSHVHIEVGIYYVLAGYRVGRYQDHAIRARVVVKWALVLRGGGEKAPAMRRVAKPSVASTPEL